ncbi:ladderlectin-like [Xiphophorus maculatus]|uniref:ladderlectin-like n=1 Tax=Xiphophorus maculatus TaxID=8083 RepID=UPI000C6D84AB|nr:ladderlectin-like [Xiphophorus maculatus]
MSWAKAERLCLSLDGHLASMRSTNEYNFIRELIVTESGRDTQTWVGGFDSAEEGTWMWSDGSKFMFHHWGLGEPSNSGGNQNCMDINFAGRDHVNDDVCGVLLPFVCARHVKALHAF